MHWLKPFLSKSKIGEQGQSKQQAPSFSSSVVFSLFCSFILDLFTLLEFSGKPCSLYFHSDLSDEFTSCFSFSQMSCSFRCLFALSVCKTTVFNGHIHLLHIRIITQGSSFIYSSCVIEIKLIVNPTTWKFAAGPGLLPTSHYFMVFIHMCIVCRVCLDFMKWDFLSLLQVTIH